MARAAADSRDTLGFGALLRGPLVGLTEEEIADVVVALPLRPDGSPSQLYLWTDPGAVSHPVLSRTLEILQNLARKARLTTPYQLTAEALEELNVRPILRARYHRGAERALANVELFLEMARAYDARGLSAFVEALRANWEEAEKQIEGRPDADVDAVSLITIHSAKGLEWPIVIPINSATNLTEDMKFLHRRSNDTVHFKLFDYAGPDYDLVKNAEREQLRRERVRLWCVALTRACDLLLLPRQTERDPSDWLSLLDLCLDELPLFDSLALPTPLRPPTKESENLQDAATWAAEAAAIAARRTIFWRSPSRHEIAVDEELGPPQEEEVYADETVLQEELPVQPGPALRYATIQGSRERGLVLHKLLEEVLTGETPEELRTLEVRARALLGELGSAEASRPEDGPNGLEIAAAVTRTLTLPDVVELRPRLFPEVTVFLAEIDGDRSTYLGGIVDALARAPNGTIDTVIDWKSDVDPKPQQIDLYRAHLRDYLAATGAKQALLVFLTTGKIERVHPPQIGG